MRNIPDINNGLQQVENLIQTKFISDITGEITCYKTERALLSLLPKLSGPGISLFSSILYEQFGNSFFNGRASKQH